MILDRQIVFFPIFSPEAKDLLNRILTLDPERRLGANGIDEIKNLASLPSLEEIRAKIVGLLVSTQTNIVSILQKNQSNIIRVINEKYKADN